MEVLNPQSMITNKTDTEAGGIWTTVEVSSGSVITTTVEVKIGIRHHSSRAFLPLDLKELMDTWIRSPTQNRTKHSESVSKIASDGPLNMKY